jgi:hypothetical protein
VSGVSHGGGVRSHRAIATQEEPLMFTSSTSIQGPLRRLVAVAASGAVVLCFAAGASADPQVQDLRSPDAIDAALVRAKGPDLRSPDAVDAADGRVTAVVAAPALREVTTSSTGFDWGDAAIGAAGAIGLILLGTGAVLLVRRHSHGGPTPLAS